MTRTQTNDSPQAQARRAQEAESEIEALRNEAARLQEENEQLKEEFRREHEIHVRNLADFANYRRRVERERTQAAQMGKRDLILALLGVLDDLERALAHADQDPQSIIEGVRAIHRRLLAVLSAQGVTAFESVSQPFDPTRHEAISLVEREGAQSGIVLDELRRGYRWGEELLRPAQVRVAQ